MTVVGGERVVGVGEGEGEGEDCHLSESPEACSSSDMKKGSSLGRFTVNCTLGEESNNDDIIMYVLTGACVSQGS